MLKALLKYRKKAVNAHGVHSPFVFEFYNEVLKKANSYEDEDIQRLRKKLKKDNSLIDITDLGAGSRKKKSNQRSLSELVKYSAISSKYGQLIGRMVEFYKMDYCLELGTSMGLGTAYMAANAKEVVTIEGCSNIFAQANKNFDALAQTNIKAINAEFDIGIIEAEQIHSEYDLIYIDGNHQYDATIKYFKHFIEKAKNDTFLIFDDIRWSEGMEKAWQEIIASDKINVSIELFRMGIVLKRQEQEKQHFILKF